MVYSEKNTPHPPETVIAVRNFCKKNGLEFRKVSFVNDNEIVMGQVYFVIHDDDLVKVIKHCHKQNLKIGEDVGVISYNDTPLKQIVGGGITVISTNFGLMGEKAAQFVKNKKKIGEILPTSLILRESL
jgi:DNA-binding LacI/PurR family transcriptional regulator